MTTGSVRGKCCALQASHSRRQPAAAIRVGCAAIGAEAVARVPGEDRLGLAEHGERVRRRPAPARRSSAGRSARGRRGRGRRAAGGRGSPRCRPTAARPLHRPAAPRKPARRRRRARAALRIRAPPSASISASGKTAPAASAPQRQDRHVARDQHRLGVRPRPQRGDIGGDLRAAPRRGRAARRGNRTPARGATVLKKASFILHPSSGRRWPIAAKPVLIRSNRSFDSLSGKRSLWL